MTCATCSAAVLAPLVPDGVSAMKIAERARRAAEALPPSQRAPIHLCADTLVWMSAELWRLRAAPADD